MLGNFVVLLREKSLWKITLLNLTKILSLNRKPKNLNINQLIKKKVIKIASTGRLVDIRAPLCQR